MLIPTLKPYSRLIWISTSHHQATGTEPHGQETINGYLGPSGKHDQAPTAILGMMTHSDSL